MNILIPQTDDDFLYAALGNVALAGMMFYHLNSTTAPSQLQLEPPGAPHVQSDDGQGEQSPEMYDTTYAQEPPVMDTRSEIPHRTQVSQYRR